MVFAQSEILQKEVFLFEMIDAVEGKPLKHLSAVCLLRVTDENIQTLIRELQKPKYGTYDICKSIVQTVRFALFVQSF